MSSRHYKPRPVASWKLWRAAWKSFWAKWQAYARIIAVVAIPIDLLGLSASLSTDATMNAYTSVAAIIMNVALVWAIIHAEKTGEVPSMSSSYYDGSVAIVRYLLVSVALVLMLIPAALGVAIYLASLKAADVASSFPELLLIGSVCLLISLPSIWLIVRFGLAPIVSVDTGMSPIASLRFARSVTLGRFWHTLARYIMLFLYLVLLALPIALVTAGLSFLKLGHFPTFFFQIATTFTALPLANIYLLNLLRNLDYKPEIDKPAE